MQKRSIKQHIKYMKILFHGLCMFTQTIARASVREYIEAQRHKSPRLFGNK